MEDFEILLDGVYGLDINYQEYTTRLLEANGRNIRHRVNTPGGDVAEATAMRNALDGYMKKYPNAKITFAVDGWVQSAGTYHMAIEGAEVSVNHDTLFMYHNPSSMAFGDYKAMASQMEFLRDMASVYAKSYAARSGKSLEDVQTEMDAETFFIGQAIVDAGFADTVEGEQDAASTHAESVVVEMGRKRIRQTIGRLAAAAYGQTIQTQPVTANDNIEQETPTMSDKKTDETQVPDVSGETARAEAWMAAIEVNPKLKAALAAKFKEGAPTEFFNGVVAVAEMSAAAQSHADAANDDPGEVSPKEPEINDAKTSRTAGMTGETAEV